MKEQIKELNGATVPPFGQPLVVSRELVMLMKRAGLHVPETWLQAYEVPPPAPLKLPMLNVDIEPPLLAAMRVCS